MADSLRHKRLDVGERKFFLNGLVDSIDEELDLIRSQDGAYATTVTTTLALVIPARTSRTFHVRTITVTAPTATANKVTFYSDAAGTVAVVPYRIGGNATYTVTGIEGMVVSQLSFQAATAASIEVFVGGVWRLT